MSAMVHTWSSDRSYSHAFVVFPFAIALAWRRREAAAAAVSKPSAWGLLIVALSASAWLLGNIGGVLVVEEFALIVLFCATVWSVEGTDLLRTMVFPLGLLFFAVPFGTGIVPWLQRFTAWFATEALQLSGIPVILENHIISVPSGTWDVAEACSGLRFLTVCAFLSVLFAGIAYRTWKRRISFVVLSLLVSVVANGLRVYGIVVLGYLSNNKLASGVDHIVYGWIFFSWVSFALLVFGVRWREPVPPAVRDDTIETCAPKSSSVGSVRKSILVGGIALIVATMAPLTAKVLWAKSTDKAVSALQPGQEWHPIQRYDWDWMPSLSKLADQSTSSFSDSRGNVVQLSIGSYYQSDQRSELVSGYNVVRDSTKWFPAADNLQEAELSGRKLNVHEVILQSSNEMRLVWFWYVIGDQFAAVPEDFKFLQAKNRLLGHPQPAAIMIISVLGASERKHAEATLQSFLSHAKLARNVEESH